MSLATVARKVAVIVSHRDVPRAAAMAVISFMVGWLLGKGVWVFRGQYMEYTEGVGK